MRYDGEGEGESLDSGRQREEAKLFTEKFSVFELFNFCLRTEEKPNVYKLF